MVFSCHITNSTSPCQARHRLSLYMCRTTWPCRMSDRSSLCHRICKSVKPQCRLATPFTTSSLKLVACKDRTLQNSLFETASCCNEKYFLFLVKQDEGSLSGNPLDEQTVKACRQEIHSPDNGEKFWRDPAQYIMKETSFKKKNIWQHSRCDCKINGTLAENV